MEGLLIAEELAKLAPLLPSERPAWRFPDAETLVLPFAKGALWLWLRPPQPHLALLSELPEPAAPRSSFQELLAARAVGPLLSADQVKLDRVLRLEFGPGAGFVPTPPVTLVAELTGRNCNAILLDEAGVILGALREVGAQANRFRQVRPGERYRPPPPYHKLDPRTAGDAELRAALAGRELGEVRKVVDGIGPELSRALALTSGLQPDTRLEGAELDAALAALRRLVAAPGTVLEQALKRPGLPELRRREAREAERQALRERLEKEAALLRRRLKDIERARAAAAEAPALRAQADLLLAFAHQVSAGTKEAMLTDFSGEPVTVPLDPRLSATQNAQALYDRARKREARLAQAERREAELRRELTEQEALLRRLDELPEAEVTALLGRLAPDEQATAPKKRGSMGLRYQGPHGFSVVVGRSAKENDALTFRLAKSRDLWLHAQGYTGSHVIVQAEGREVPFETVLFAAQLAAAYSKAGQSENVAVDYTLRKHVWKPKGAAPGQAHYTQQKTVYVTPTRRPEN